MDPETTQPDSIRAPQYAPFSVVISQVRLGIRLDAELCPPETLASGKFTNRDVFNFHNDKLSLAERTQKPFITKVKVISITPEGTDKIARTQFADLWFMAGNMDKVLSLLEASQMYVTRYGDGWRAGGWQFKGIITLVRSQTENIPKWLDQGCKDNHIKMDIDNSFIPMKFTRKL